MKRKIRILLALMLCLLTVCGATACADAGKEAASGEPTSLSFKAAASYDYLKELDGKPVTINGYMATSSPVDGSFMFLMNLPYQSCPFCEPNTSKLSNTMEVYPKKGDSFAYTTQAIRVEGTLVVAKSGKPFTDEYGYEFNYKLVDATYTIIPASELSADMALWQKIAESGVINDVYAMYDYVNFVCAWPSYFVNSYVGEDGTPVPGYFLYASDAENFLYTDGAQWNYGYKEGYFDGIIAKIRAVDPTAFEDLVANIEKAKTLAQKGLAELAAGNYTAEQQYVEKFGSTDWVYTLNNGEALVNELQLIFNEFSNWLGSWEM